MRIRPKSSPSGSRLRLQRPQACVARKTSEPPGVAATHHFVVEAPPVRQAHIGDGAAIPVLVADDHLHDLTERQLRHKLLRSLPERLALLGRVDAVQTDGLRPALVKHGDGVAIRHTDNLAVEGIGPSAGLPTTEKKERNSNSSGELDVEIG
jgi:hypothetical protein